MPPTAADPIARLAALCSRWTRDNGLTQAEIAERAGMKRVNLSRILSGRRDPAFSSVCRILEAIGCTLADLVE